MSTPNPRNLSPVPGGPEREPQTYDVAVAQNSRRKGESFAFEGLGYQQRYHGSFYEAVRDSDTGASHTDVEVQPAGQANGRSLLGSGQFVPAQFAVDAAERGGFVQGLSGSEQSATPYPFMHQLRPGAANASPLGPTFGFNAGERPGAIFAKQTAPPRGGRHRNEAEVD